MRVLRTLAAGVAALALSSGAANATVFTWTFTGTVSGPGLDENNYFGPTRDMTGETWTAVLVADTTIGLLNSFSFPGEQGQHLSNTSPFATGTPVTSQLLTIGGYSLPVPPHDSFQEVDQSTNDGLSDVSVDTLIEPPPGGPFHFSAVAVAFDPAVFPAAFDTAFDVDTSGSGFDSGGFFNGTGENITFSIAHVSSVITADPLPSDVPEPATWALMLVGAGLLGAQLRGRRFSRFRPSW